MGVNKIFNFASQWHVDARVQTNSNTATLIEGHITHVVCVQLGPKLTQDLTVI